MEEIKEIKQLLKEIIKLSDGSKHPQSVTSDKMIKFTETALHKLTILGHDLSIYKEDTEYYRKWAKRYEQRLDVYEETLKKIASEGVEHLWFTRLAKETLEKFNVSE